MFLVAAAAAFSSLLLTSPRPALPRKRATVSDTTVHRHRSVYADSHWLTGERRLDNDPLDAEVWRDFVGNRSGDFTADRIPPLLKVRLENVTRRKVCRWDRQPRVGPPGRWEVAGTKQGWEVAL